MSIDLTKLKTPKDHYLEIIRKEISKLKSGYGISYVEMAEKCGISISMFYKYNFQKLFKVERHNKANYFVK